MINNFNGLLFLDAGNCWYKGEEFKLIGSIGWGIRYNFYGIVLKWDYAKLTDFYDIIDDIKHKDYRIDFAIGYNW